MDWEQIYGQLASDPNDAQAWDALAGRVRVWARADFWKRGAHVVEDVTADTCAAVVLGITGARGAETFAGYTYGHFLNVRRHVLRGVLNTDVPLGNLDMVAPLEEDELDADSLTRLRQAVSTLPPRERTAVTLRYFHEQPSAVIAAQLGVTEGNARRILFNGLRHLRAKLGTRESVAEARCDIAPVPHLTQSAAEIAPAPAR